MLYFYGNPNTLLKKIQMTPLRLIFFGEKYFPLLKEHTILKIGQYIVWGQHSEVMLIFFLQFQYYWFLEVLWQIWD